MGHGNRGPLQLHRAAVRPLQAPGEPRALRAFHLLEPPEDRLPVVGGRELFHGLARERCCGGESQEPAAGGVGEDDTAVREEQESVGLSLGQALVLLLALAQRLGGAPPLGHVLHHELQAPVGEPAHRELGLDHISVVRAETALALAVPGQMRERVPLAVTIGFVREEVPHALAEDLRPWLAEERAGGGVGIGDAPVRGGEEHTGRGLLREQAVLLRAAAQRFHRRLQVRAGPRGLAAQAGRPSGISAGGTSGRAGRSRSRRRMLWNVGSR